MKRSKKLMNMTALRLRLKMLKTMSNQLKHKTRWVKMKLNKKMTVA